MKKDGQLPLRYSKQLRQRFGLWPSWLPDSPVRVGDFGRVRNGIFEREGNIEEMRIEVASLDPRALGDLVFASRGTRQAMLGTAGTAVELGAVGARIEFTRSFGVFVGLRGCAERRLADPLETAAALSELRSDNGWRNDACLVTGVVDAAAALIAVGSGGGGALEVSATAPAPDLLTWIGADLRITSETSLGFRALLPNGCSPLFRLARLAEEDELVPRGPVRPRVRLMEIDPRAGLR